MSTGELAAIGTAVCWTASPLAFEAASRRIGSLSLNLLRVTIALAWLALLGAIVDGRPAPTGATAAQWGWLAASGAVGLVLGDLCTFRAYVVMGARRVMVVSTTTPIFTAALAWLFLDERLAALDVAGMAIIVGGVALAVRARAPSAVDVQAADIARGTVLAVGGALGQAGGLLLSKHGLRGYPPVAGTQIRMLAALAGYLIVLTAVRWWPRVGGALRDRRALGLSAIGALFGPCLGVALSLYAVTHAHAGVASALMSIAPVLIIPVAMARGERVAPIAIVASLAAVGGVALLALA
jgi:drug/metabolite transporter (DMT)-like permease